MAKNALKEVLKKQSELMTPSKAEMFILEAKTKEIVSMLRDNLRKNKIVADVFVGGSFSKNTLIKKDKYDVDVFVRFDKKYKDEELSKLLGRIVIKNSRRIHGSRDYFSFNDKADRVDFEIIPVVKIIRPDQARNITDLSYFHVNYVNKKIEKNKKLADEIRLAKAFAYYQGCYGAESYINGFSGYGIELLISHYKTFMKFIEAVAKFDIKKQEKIVIDDEKSYKNKEAVMRELNESKLLSPIVLIDPTHKDRNALAALSAGTFIKFKEACTKFLKSPSDKFFEFVDVEKKILEKYEKKLIRLEISTEKQSGDIAGTKLKKFYNFFLKETQRYFDVKESIFKYDEDANVGRIILVPIMKKEIIFSGPPITMEKELRLFKKEHKKIKIVKGKAQASEKSIEFNEFLKNFLNQKSKVILDMDVSDIKQI